MRKAINPAGMNLSGLAFLLVWGAVGLASRPAAGRQAVPTAQPPVNQAPTTVVQASDLDRVAKLRQLVEAAEKALDEEDEDAAFDRSDEAEVLVADWNEVLLQRPDVQILLERLKGVQNQVSENAPPGSPSSSQGHEGAPGLKEQGQVTILKGNDLSLEAAKVRAADQGAVYDFPIDLNDKVLTWVRLFTTEKRGYMERTLARGSAYFPMIRQVFAEEGVPQDLAYLGVVESGYINQAKSYARAVGMWQFMPSTGRLFGLKINRWVDERRDPVKSTHAAARYLRRLYELSGDWYLALVGYNAGPLTTQKAQQNLGTSNFWDMYRSPYLRNQTKNYVPELCAAILIAHHPDRYGFQAAPEQPFVYESVEVRSATSLRTIARYAGVGDAVIKELNPQLLRGTTPPGAYEVRVPVGKGLETQRRIGGRPARKIAASVPLLHGESAPPVPVAPLEGMPSIPKGEAPASASTGSSEGGIYRARRGDTLAKIARAKGFSLGDLLRLNPEAAKHLAVGDQVILPGSASEPAKTPSAAKPQHHSVRRGETLSSIGDRYGVSIEHLMQWNGLKSSRIHPGQRLRLAPR